VTPQLVLALLLLAAWLLAAASAAGLGFSAPEYTSS
jgi:hypothetical protein